jgi:hypothetical protein
MSAINIMEQSIMDSNMFSKNFEDPFDRLGELEIVQMGQGLAMVDLSEQLKTQSQLGVKISDHMMEMVRYIDVLGSKIRELEMRLEQLEH